MPKRSALATSWWLLRHNRTARSLLWLPVSFPGGTGFEVTRYNRDGSLDASFGNIGRTDYGSGGGDFGGGSTAFGFAIEPDGKIVVIGTSTSTIPEWDPIARQLIFMTKSWSYAVRFGSDGILDRSFGTNGAEILLLGKSNNLDP